MRIVRPKHRRFDDAGASRHSHNLPFLQLLQSRGTLEVLLHPFSRTAMNPRKDRRLYLPPVHASHDPLNELSSPVQQPQEVRALLPAHEQKLLQLLPSCSSTQNRTNVMRTAHTANHITIIQQYIATQHKCHVVIVPIQNTTS